MRFGLFGSTQVKRGDSLDGSHGFARFIDYNVEAEALGFHSSFVVEHHFTGFGQVSATLTLLAWLGARTTTLRLGTAVIVLPWHNPILLAEQAATIDLMTGGRLDLGIGKGYRYNEFAGFGIPMEEADARFEESLELLLRSWTSEERWSHKGRFYEFADVVVEPPSVQKPHPPIWMGAGSQRSLDMVAQRGFNLLLDQISPIDAAIERFAYYRGRVQALGRTFNPYQVGLSRGLYVAKDAADRDAAIERRIAARARIDALAQRPDGKNTASLLSFDLGDAVRDGVLFGTVDEIAARIERLHKAGVRYMLVTDGGSGIEGLRTFAREIIPAFADPEDATLAAAAE
ncbi:MAG: LLM class flavin-dependent oxidoreductase [Alphaproteobacteria bacterium]